MMLFVMMQTSVAFADTDPVAIANATSNVNAGAAASADNNSVTTNTSSSGVNLAPGAVATTAIAGASTSEVGPVNIQTGGTSLEFHGSTQAIPPPLPSFPFASGSVPQIIPLPQNATVQEAGLMITSRYKEVCPSRLVRGYEDEMESSTFDGVSGNTRIIFTPHINYARKVVNGRGWFKKTPLVQEVEPIMFDASGHFRCLGIVTITAKDKEVVEVSPASVLSDVENFPLQKMKRVNAVTLLTMSSAISATKGANNNGGGISLGGVVSQFTNPLMAAVGGGVTSTSGVTFPVTMMGGTFLVLEKADPKDPDAVFIDLSPKKPEPVPEAIVAPPQVEVAKPEPLPVVVVPPPVVAPPVEAKAVEPVIAPPVATENKTAVVPVVVANTTKPKKRAVKKVPPVVVPVSYVINCEKGVSCTVNLKDAMASTPLPQPEPKKADTVGAVQREEESAGFFSKIFR